MTGDSLIWALAVLSFATAMAATPGPNNAMLAASGASFGFRRTLPHMLGVTIGFPMLILTVDLGAGAALRSMPWVETAMRWVGIAYLLWLAWKIARARPDGAHAARGRPLTFMQAALFQWVNPKGWVAAFGAIMAYATEVGSRHVAQALTIAAIFFLVSLPCTAFWIAVGAGVARFLRAPDAVRRFNLAMALLLLASLVPAVIEAVRG